MGDVMLLLGLEETLGQELQRALRGEDRIVQAYPSLPPEAARALIDRLRPAMVFLGGDWRNVRQLLRSAISPVIVVSRRPEVSDWLDAIEAGAADYCAPPFESAHLRWILESARRTRAAAA